MSQDDKGHKPTHQVIADGNIIYEGADWATAFKDSAMHPEYGEIVVMCDGQPGARWSAPRHWQHIDYSQTPLDS